LVREPLLLVGGSDADLREDGPVQLSDLGELKFVLPGRPNLLRHVAEAAMRRRGFAFHSAVEAESLGLCLDLVRRGAGFTVMPYCAIYGSHQQGAFHWAPIVGLGVTWAVTVNEGREAYSGVKVIANAIVERVRQVVAGNEWRGAEIVGTNDNATTTQ
jgi:LysR family nitrogen assimilation transcriptional regulator